MSTVPAAVGKWEVATGKCGKHVSMLSNHLQTNRLQEYEHAPQWRAPGGRSPAAALSLPRFRGLFTRVLSAVDRPNCSAAQQQQQQQHGEQTLLQLILPPTESWMAPHLHLRLSACSNFIAQHLSISATPSPPPQRRRQSEPGQVSYLHRAARAKPILREDGDPNVTNPSVPV